MKQILLLTLILLALISCKSQRDKNHEERLRYLLVEELKSSDLWQEVVKKKDSLRANRKLNDDTSFMSRYYKSEIESDLQKSAVKNLKERIHLEK